MIGIYKIRNKVTGKVYIGKSTDIEERWNEHRRLLRNNNHHSIKLQKAYNKYGEDAFEYSVIETTPYEKTLDILEQKYMAQFNSVEDGYNMVGVDAFGKWTTEKKLTKARRQKMINEEYVIMLNQLDLFQDDIKITGKTYRERVYSKHYKYLQYSKINKLLNIMYNNFYQKGDEIILDILCDKNRIKNVTTSLTIMFGKEKDTVNVWDGDLGLFYKNAKTYYTWELMR